MNEEVIETVDQDEAAALASAIAGYEKKTMRGDEPPVEVVPDEPEHVQEEAPASNEPTVADELAALKAKVHAMAATNDPDAVRKLHGDIGDINRTLKNLQKSEQAPFDEELTAAMTAAESVADEYPELAGPLVKAIKALGATRQTPAHHEPENVDERISAAVEHRLQKNAIEALQEEHPDYSTVRETPEFKAWEKTKTPEFVQKLWASWNPAVVARGLTEFKDSIKARQKKQDRLAGAVTPQGVPSQAKSSTLPDDAGFSVGYNKARKRP